MTATHKEGDVQSQGTVRRRWGRRGALVVGLLVIGAVVNVGVAWGCVLAHREGTSLYEETAFGRGWRKMETISSFGYESVWARTFTGEDFLDEETLACGWPTLCLQYSEIKRGLRERREFRGHLRLSGRARRWIGSDVLPIGLRASGLTVNTVFYASVISVMTVRPGIARRALRRRRGQCVGCGYEVGELAVCPECGAKAKVSA